ncbi:MAG: prepilin-type N-terminal cleavage/methylation domain-containing protein [Egibacteraceae bacterium]
MLRVERSRLADETGVTLVEMMVALLVLGLVLTAFLSVMTASFSSIRQNAAMTRATALANEVLEEFRAVPWSRLSEFEDCDSTTEARDGQAYSVERCVEFVDAPQTESGTRDYALLKVNLEWNTSGRERDMSLESLRAPLPDEQEPAEFVFAEGQVTPVVSDVNSAGQLTGQPEALRVDARVVPAATSVTLTFEDALASREVELVSTDGGSTWEDQPSSTDWVFAHGDVNMELTARWNGGHSEVISLERLRRFQWPLQILGINLEGATEVCPGEALDIRVDVQGLGSDDVIELHGEYITTEDGEGLQPSRFEELTDDVDDVGELTVGRSYFFSIAPDEWAEGSVFEVRVFRSSDELETDAQYVIEVGDECETS